MSLIQDLERALINADAAGDVDAARLLAKELRIQLGDFTSAPMEEPDFLDQIEEFGRVFLGGLSG